MQRSRNFGGFNNEIPNRFSLKFFDKKNFTAILSVGTALIHAESQIQKDGRTNMKVLLGLLRHLNVSANLSA
jgi:hypothetical protein